MFRALSRLKFLFSAEDRNLKNPAILRAVSRSDQAIPTSAEGAVVLFEVEKEKNAILIADGEATFLRPTIYNFFVSFNLGVTAGFASAIESWAEVFDPVSGWLPAPDTGKVLDFDRFNQGYIDMSVNVTVRLGSKVRVKIRSRSGNPELKAQALDNGVVSPSAQISISEV